MSTQTFGAIAPGKAVNNGKCKWLQGRRLSTGGFNSSAFSTKAAQHWGTQQNDEREPNNRLDGGARWAHRFNRAKQSNEKNRSDGRTGGLCGRRLPGEPGAVGYWSGD